jgi:hypothetical protein
MVTLVRLARVLLLLVLTFVVLSLVIGIGSGTTGALEKAVLVLLIVGCVALAAKVSTVAGSLQTRLQRH